MSSVAVHDTNLMARARYHAALGEPARLAISDHLRLGDASPGDLAELIGMPTNLMAHHLRVLEAAGVVRRLRSEGDGRRSYVRLQVDEPATTSSRPLTIGTDAPRVVFVCTRNSARSQLAAAAWRRVSSLPVTSAGTQPAQRVHPGARRAAKRHGLVLPDEPPRDVAATAVPTDLVVAVCDNAHEHLVAGGPAGRRWLHWSVPDPVRVGTDAAFDAAYEDVTRRVRRLADVMPCRVAPTP